MPWLNGDLVVYHGTDNLSANAIRNTGIDPAKFRPRTDFGAGFYVTTVMHQAEQWANQRTRRTTGASNAEVLEYRLARTDICTLEHLVFVVDSPDYYDLIAYCRTGYRNHHRARAYDVVYGPVSLWPQALTIANCDQMLFSDPNALPGFSYPSASRVPPHLARFF